jgi:glutamate-1-semialdehyde aminotransferase
VQLVDENVPPAPPSSQVTVPVGFVPLTVALQFDDPPMVTELHETEVVLVAAVTLTPVVPEFGALLESPEYAAVIVAEPTADGV